VKTENPFEGCWANFDADCDADGYKDTSFYSDSCEFDTAEQLVNLALAGLEDAFDDFKPGAVHFNGGFCTDFVISSGVNSFDGFLVKPGSWGDRKRLQELAKEVSTLLNIPLRGLK